MENHRFISKSDSAKARSNRKHIRQQKVHLNVQDSVHASVNPASSHTEDDYNQPKTPPHSVHATVNRASHDAEDHLLYCLIYSLNTISLQTFTSFNFAKKQQRLGFDYEFRLIDRFKQKHPKVYHIKLWATNDVRVKFKSCGNIPKLELLYTVAFLEARESSERKNRNDGLRNAYSIVQYQYANYLSPLYKVIGKGFLKLQLINQRSDFSFALFCLTACQTSHEFFQMTGMYVSRVTLFHCSCWCACSQIDIVRVK
ncbi:hypothetical protein JHK87_000598 [Glycine soja]|nr:hypothetical protein JHK87_000598 [Glycine soja]